MKYTLFCGKENADCLYILKKAEGILVAKICKIHVLGWCYAVLQAVLLTCMCCMKGVTLVACFSLLA
jgi:hypothetical protein